MGKRGRKPMSPEVRFWRYVRKNEVCWEWTASLNHSGYGVFAPLATHKNGKIEGAHRYSWKLHYGEIPKGKYVCHSCDNPKCVRPDHLFLGTQRENMDDMIDKGRFKSKLTIEDVKFIKSSRLTQVKLAAKFGVRQTTISNVITGHAWGHVEVDNGR